MKAVSLAAPKMDFLVKQEQQVFSLQSFLAVTGEQFENDCNRMQEPYRHRAQLMDVHHVVRFVRKHTRIQAKCNE